MSGNCLGSENLSSRYRYCSFKSSSIKMGNLEKTDMLTRYFGRKIFNFNYETHQCSVVCTKAPQKVDDLSVLDIWRPRFRPWSRHRLPSFRQGRWKFRTARMSASCGGLIYTVFQDQKFWQNNVSRTWNEYGILNFDQLLIGKSAS